MNTINADYMMEQEELQKISMYLPAHVLSAGPIVEVERIFEIVS